MLVYVCVCVMCCRASNHILQASATPAPGLWQCRIWLSAVAAPRHTAWLQPTGPRFRFVVQTHACRPPLPHPLSHHPRDQDQSRHLPNYHHRPNPPHHQPAVFRTNSSYARWLDARQQWGLIVNTSRTFIRQVMTTLPESR